MEIRAIAKSVRMGPRKIRLIADMIRELSIEEALLALQTTNKRAALPLEKALKSAIANGVNNAGLESKNLSIQSIQVTDGAALKRFMPSTRGRIHPYKRRSSNIRIVLKTKDVKPAAKKQEDKKVKRSETPHSGEVKSLPAGKETPKKTRKGEN
jgi:large subunit ribosomal protein L22